MNQKERKKENKERKTWEKKDRVLIKNANSKAIIDKVKILKRNNIEKKTLKQWQGGNKKEQEQP